MKYDIECARKNIKDFIKRKGIKQKELAETLKMDEGRISNCLTGKNGSFFTSEQLLCFANHYSISLDEICSDESKQNFNSDITMVNVLEMLFSLGNMGKIALEKRQVKESDNSSNIEYAKSFNETEWNIQIKDKYLNDLLLDWNKLLLFPELSTSKGFSKSVCEIWQEDTLRRTTDIELKTLNKNIFLQNDMIEENETEIARLKSVIKFFSEYYNPFSDISNEELQKQFLMSHPKEGLPTEEEHKVAHEKIARLDLTNDMLLRVYETE